MRWALSVMRVVVGAGHGFGSQEPTVNAEAIAFLTAHLSRIPGDYNADHIVDDADYLLWTQDFGTRIPDADGNADGLVDAADYTVRRDHLGATSGSGAGAAVSTFGGAVPEPTTLMMALVAAALLCIARVAPATNRRRSRAAVPFASFTGLATAVRRAPS